MYITVAASVAAAVVVVVVSEFRRYGRRVIIRIRSLPPLQKRIFRGRVSATMHFDARGVADCRRNRRQRRLSDTVTCLRASFAYKLARGSWRAGEACLRLTSARPTTAQKRCRLGRDGAQSGENFEEF